MADTAPDGVWLAELAPVDDPKAVPEAVLTAVGARETVLRGAGAEEMRAAAERHDDPSSGSPVLRQAAHADRPRQLRARRGRRRASRRGAPGAVPGLTVLATSREPLGVPGELLRPVEPLPEPFALQLLADRGAAAARVSGSRTTPRPPPRSAAASTDCRSPSNSPPPGCGCSPRVRSPTGSTTGSELLLTSGSRTVLPRQQTLRAVGQTGPGTSSTRTNGTCCGGCPSSRAAATSPPPRPSADRPPWKRSARSSTSPPSWPLLGGTTRCATGSWETVGEYAGEQLDESGQRRRRARPPHALPRSGPHHRPPAARPGPARRHRTAGDRVGEHPRRPPARRRRPRRAGGALPGPLPDLVLADARSAADGPPLVP